MGWPQWAVILWIVLSLGIVVGTPVNNAKEAKDFMLKLVKYAVLSWLLWIGGFFSVR